jgi:hypothetical protein
LKTAILEESRDVAAEVLLPVALMKRSTLAIDGIPVALPVAETETVLRD